MQDHSQLKTIMFIMLTSVCLINCASSPPQTYSSVAPGIDFRGIKSFGFLEKSSTDSAGFQSMETSFLKAAVARQLELRGLSFETENPDVLMNFNISTDEKISTRRTPTMNGGYYGYRTGYYDGFGYAGPAYETRIDQYTVGTLTIDMIDPKARKLMWEGTVTGRLKDTDSSNLEMTVNQAVADIFVKFPVLDAQLEMNAQQDAAR